ncbi:MAG: hypothetical protein Q9220_007354 [cf. Caloplaca sp. 1 TL-2023]
MVLLTNCGHGFGGDCHQRWTSNGDDSCPECDFDEANRSSVAEQRLGNWPAGFTDVEKWSHRAGISFVRQGNVLFYNLCEAIVQRAETDLDNLDPRNEATLTEWIRDYQYIRAVLSCTNFQKDTAMASLSRENESLQPLVEYLAQPDYPLDVSIPLLAIGTETYERFREWSARLDECRDRGYEHFGHNDGKETEANLILKERMEILSAPFPQRLR